MKTDSEIIKELSLENDKLKRQIGELEGMKETARNAQKFEDDNQRLFNQKVILLQEISKIKEKNLQAIDILKKTQPLEKQKSDFKKIIDLLK